MEIIGDDKKLRALYSETRFGDEEVAPSFSATWHRAQSRAVQPGRSFNLALASSMALVIFAIGGFAIWSRYSPTRSYSSYASATAIDLVPTPPKITPPTTEPVVAIKYSGALLKPRRIRFAGRQQSLIAENRKTEKAAKEIESWQSPTAALLSSPSDDLFKSLPQLNENANELKSFLPNHSNDKEN